MTSKTLWLRKEKIILQFKTSGGLIRLKSMAVPQGAGMVTEDRPIAENLEGSECCHHWVIEATEGPLNEGICQKCGEAKKLTNYIERDTRNEPARQATEPSN